MINAAGLARAGSSALLILMVAGCATDTQAPPGAAPPTASESPSAAPATKPAAKPSSASPKPFRPDKDVPWENYAPSVRAGIDRMGEAKDCAGLQQQFDTADANSDATRERTGESNADLMGYIDAWMRQAGCYG